MPTHTPPVVDRLLTAAEVSQRLRVPLKTLYGWRAAGLGPRSAKIGIRLVFRESEVNAWIDQQFEQDADAKLFDLPF